MNTCLSRTICILCLVLATLFFAVHALHAQTKDVVVEEIIARVNNDIVTLSDYEKAQATLRQEVAQDCQGCTQDKLDDEYRTRSKDLLRDLIDQDLLVQRAKDEGVSVETDLIKRLDDVRKENNLASLDDLEKAVESQGLSWDDYKAQLRNSLLTQEIIRRDVGSRINISDSDSRAYYEAHKQEFVKPEEVVLAEIFLSTQGKTPQEMGVIEVKADDLHQRLVNGDDFNELAKRYSEGSTAKDGGELGTFQRGQLSKQIEDAVFKLDKGHITDVIQTKTGFEILKVEAHYIAGLQPYEKVQDDIMNRIYMQRVQPALRDYLAQLREESYVTVKPGYVDSAAVPGTSVITEVAPTPDTQEKTKGKKKFPHPKVNGL
ncbi:MAG TPA: peptidylprolyl isomerase [Candidatus Acidoferrum sp.]|nr:peptidylprolyl isomerase [Candidatus Acidoferrum sp.]